MTLTPAMVVLAS